MSLIGKALSRSGGGGYTTTTRWRCAGECHNAIRYACGKDEGYAASCSFDDSSLSFGASLVGAIDATIDDDDNDGNDRTSRRSRLREAKRIICDRGPDPRMGHVIICHRSEIILANLADLLPLIMGLTIMPFE